MHKPFMKGPGGRLEDELAAALAPVAAPDELWDRVQAGIERRGGSSWRPVWTLAAACCLLAAAAGVLWSGYVRQRGAWELEAVALAAHQDWIRNPQRLDLRTSSPRELRQWMEARSPLTAAVAIERPQPDPDALTLLGVRWLSFQGKKIAAIAYRLGDYPATLLIAKSEGPVEPGEHLRVRTERREGVKLYSWSMHGQVYTLVSSIPEESQRACVLCHAEPQKRQMILRAKIAG